MLLDLFFVKFTYTGDSYVGYLKECVLCGYYSNVVTGYRSSGNYDVPLTTLSLFRQSTKIFSSNINFSICQPISTSIFPIQNLNFGNMGATRKLGNPVFTHPLLCPGKRLWIAIYGKLSRAPFVPSSGLPRLFQPNIILLLVTFTNDLHNLPRQIIPNVGWVCLFIQDFLVKLFKVLFFILEFVTWVVEWYQVLH